MNCLPCVVGRWVFSSLLQRSASLRERLSDRCCGNALALLHSWHSPDCISLQLSSYSVSGKNHATVRRTSHSRSTATHILSYRPLVLFSPTWIAVNAILGVWISAQIEFVLAGNLHVGGQQFVGSLHGRSGTLSAILGGYVLWFAVCVVIWALIVGRLPRLPTLLMTVFGSVPASVGLIALNHGCSPLIFGPPVLIGVFLEAGFTPTALAHLADISQVFARDRGLLMGLYPVMLGLGQLVGAVVGGLFAQLAYFDGLAYLTMILACVAIGPLVATMILQRSMSGLAVAR